MGRKCSVESCSSDSNRAEDTGVTFHKVPLHNDLRPKWISLCRIPEDKKSVKVIYVCSRHFLRADFCHFKGKKYMLKHGVLPSVFPWDKSKLEALKAEAAVKKETNVDKKKPKKGKNSHSKGQKVESNIEIETKLNEKVDGSDFVVKEEATEESEEVKDFDEQLKIAQTSAAKTEEANIGSSSHINFTINSRIEVLDNNSFWYPAKITEVDYEENEVLIHFEKFSSKYDEWIPMNSARLRPVQAKPIQKYEIGERCMASWSDSRKFPATITKTLMEDTYEVLFDDGFVKILKQHRLSKMQAGKPSQASPLFDPIKSTKQERRDRKRKLNVAALFRKRPRLSLNEDKKVKDVKEPPAEESPAAAAPSDAVSSPPSSPAEDPTNWHPKWLNGKPVGTESTIETIDGVRKSIIVPDPRLPAGWFKHLCQRQHGSSAGKWDTIIKSPDNRRFRSRTEIRNYLTAHPDIDVDFDLFDFSIYRNSRRRASKPKDAEVLSAAEPPLPPPCQPETEEEEEAIPDEPALKIAFEDDAYKCPIEGCGKNFRRENLALMHVKHYHPEYSKYLESTPNVADLAYARTVGESLDSSPGPVKVAVAVKPQVQDKAPGTPRPEHKPAKDAELIKILNQALGDDKSSDIKPKDLADQLAPGSPYPDIKLKDLLEDTIVPKRDEVPPPPPPKSTIKTLLPKLPPAPSADLPLVDHASPDQLPLTEPASPPQQDDEQHQSFDGIIIEGGKIIKLERMKQEEIINCTCGFAEEDGLMIQCELCLCWQHAYCNNIQRETEVPEKYVCRICQNPWRERGSMRWLHDQEWLKQGTLPTSSFHAKDSEVAHARFDKLKRSHDVTGGLLELKEYLHALSLKLMIAEAKNHPKLYLWSKPWDKPRLPEKSDAILQSASATKPKLENGDHQYIKNELGVEKPDLSNESMLMMILKAGKEDIALPNVQQNSAPIIPRPEAAINLDDCRLNLLDHISHSSSLIEERLDHFEKQIVELEAGTEGDPDEECAKTRQTIQMLLRDLDKLKAFSQVPMG
ncbi:PHD finger protein 20 [Cylas formicarius]|uniref:PHD finger protein 20 n=1 Tax=Cylas formicarius TaxID=197179 RepID=UPI002958AC06|nr:PHD finger protein 20 [Cylas formicarius]